MDKFLINQLRSAAGSRLKSKTKTSFVFDNDALNALLCNDDHLAEFADFINSENVEINIPSDVVVEFTTGKITVPGDERAGVLFRITQLRKFAGKLDNLSKVKFNLPFPKQVSLEINRPKRKSRRLRSIPDPANTVLLGARDVTDFVDEIQKIAAKRRLATELLKKEDKKARSLKLLRAEYIADHIQEFRRRRVKIILRPLLTHQSRRFDLDLTGNLISRILTSQKRYPILNVFYDLLALHHIIVLLPKADASEELKPLLSIDRNDRPDMFVAATAAQQDFFVTFDKSLAARCHHLRAQGVLKFETIRLDACHEMTAGECS